jgi:hypothetical protein
LRSIGDTWTAITRFESTALQWIVPTLAAAVGLVLSWRLTEAHTSLFGYSEVAAVSLTLCVFWSLYVGLSYLVTILLERVDRQ